MAAAQWEIVGGADKGGVLVRKGQKLDSEACADRVATGSIVEQVALEGERLSYKLVSGSGPEVGWISIKVKGKELAVKKGQAKGEAFPDNNYLGKELEEEREEMWPVGKDGVELSVRLRTPAAGEKLKCCVLFVCGMPQSYFGNARMEDALPTKIMEKCWELGFPTVRFNFTGYGNSKGEEISLEDQTTMPSDFSNVFKKVLDEISPTVAVIAFSAGNLVCAVPTLAQPKFAGRCRAYVNISMGNRSTAMVSSNSKEIMAMPPEEFLKQSVPSVARIAHVPHLFIKAAEDWMTPEADLQFLIDLQKKYAPAGSKASGELLTLPGKHAFEGEGLQEAPAEAIKQFLLKTFS